MEFLSRGEVSVGMRPASSEGFGGEGCGGSSVGVDDGDIAVADERVGEESRRADGRSEGIEECQRAVRVRWV